MVAPLISFVFKIFKGLFLNICDSGAPPLRNIKTKLTETLKPTSNQSALSPLTHKIYLISHLPTK